MVGDEQMFPLRGALVRVKQPKRAITAAHAIAHEEGSSSEQDIVFVVPRGEDTVVLGGLVQPNRWDCDLTLDQPSHLTDVQGVCRPDPALKDLELDPDEHVRTGLRPFSENNVLLERVPGSKIVLNYGHGGSGVTLSWGCAEQVVQHIRT